MCVIIPLLCSRHFSLLKTTIKLTGVFSGFSVLVQMLKFELNGDPSTLRSSLLLGYIPIMGESLLEATLEKNFLPIVHLQIETTDKQFCHDLVFKLPKVPFLVCFLHSSSLDSYFLLKKSATHYQVFSSNVRGLSVVLNQELLRSRCCFLFFFASVAFSVQSSVVP